MARVVAEVADADDLLVRGRSSAPELAQAAAEPPGIINPIAATTTARVSPSTRGSASANSRDIKVTGHEIATVNLTGDSFHRE